MFTIPPPSGDIMAICLDGAASPSININLQQNNEANQAHGWGFGWYPNDHHSVMLTKDPIAKSAGVLIDAITDWSNFRSTIFFSKVHGASQGYVQAQTQPFARIFAGRDWMFMHNGHLDKGALSDLQKNQSRMLEPLSSTDSEAAFCYLLEKIQQGEARRIADINPNELREWLLTLDKLGSADIFLADGDSVVCFHGSQSPKDLYYSRIQPPESQSSFKSLISTVRLNDPRDTYRTALIVSSSPFSTGQWETMHSQQMMIIRRGLVIWDSAAELNALQPNTNTPVDIIDTPPPKLMMPQPAMNETVVAKQAQEHILNPRALTHSSDGQPLNYRLFKVRHKTQYQYTTPVEHSTHFFRLQPTEDPLQEVVSSRLSVSSPTEEIQYEDVFGNQAIHSVINAPYSHLTVEATSIVKIFAMPPDDHSLSRRQTSIPLVWMPWQRQMFMPYLLPSELPETQLTELTDYAMSFVERNDYHLLKTIEDINLSLYRDYKYAPGITSLSTTAFEVYSSRQGVCQDFANLFICLTRLLSIPARYRMGYIYTGVNYANKIQSDASHAWVEVYLPYVGWRGFDPTNGCQVKQDHIRVACGRNYRDATPTAGTIYKGGGTETLTADVHMEEITDENL